MITIDTVLAFERFPEEEGKVYEQGMQRRSLAYLGILLQGRCKVAGTQKDPPHLVEGQKTEETWADLLS